MYLLDISSSSPPHPQNELENPLTARNCLTVIADTPPNMELYGNLKDHKFQLILFLKINTIYLLKSHSINSNRHMTWLIRTRIQIAIVHR